MKSLSYTLIGILFSLSFSSGVFAQPEIGKTAPDFSLPGHDGKTYKLSEQKGKFVVLEWFNNDCPYVDKHYDEKFRNMQTLQQKWREDIKKSGQELVWFAIVSSAPGKQGHVSAAQATKIRDKDRNAHMQSILLDPKGDVGRLYSAKTTPHMYIVDPKGTLVYNGAIDDKPSARISSISGANNYVTAALTALIAGKAVAKANTKPYGCSVKY